MNDLDDLDRLRTYDPSDYLGVVENFPDQLRDALHRAQQAQDLPSGEGIDSIAILGMGGSGISGDVARVILGPRVPLFIETIKGYEIPTWVGRNTLVLAMSYSGNTEETLEAYEGAHEKGARMVVVSTGGSLVKLAREHGDAVVEIPSGLQPRAALGYLSIPILVVCEHIGVGPKMGAEIAETIDLMERRSGEWQRKIPLDSNPPKQLAKRLFDKIPLIYGSDGISGVAAYRWKCQFNECSKLPAWSNAFSELNHNEIVGWNQMSGVTKQFFGLVVLRHEGDHPRNARRIEITVPLIERNVSFVEYVDAQGSSPLARFFDLCYFGDFVSTYLALAEGIDPAPVEVIESLKKQLR